MNKTALTFLWAFSLWGSSAFAHDGHGLVSTHWHATDALGFVIAAALVAVAIYFDKK